MNPFRDSISAVCVAAAWSDGQIGDFEKQALDRIHVQLGYTRTEIMEIIGSAVKDGPSGDSIVIPNQSETQKEFMRYALAVCLADGSINPHEVKFLSELSKFLSIPTDVLEELRRKAELILNPGETEAPPAAERVEALLPEQKIQLGQSEQSTNSVRDLEAEMAKCGRRALSELLFQGESYGEEISFS